MSRGHGPKWVATRRVHFAGCTANSDDPWMQQIARNLTDGFLNGKKYLIMDRDTKYTPSFCAARPTCPLWFRDSHLVIDKKRQSHPC